MHSRESVPTQTENIASGDRALARDAITVLNTMLWQCGCSALDYINPAEITLPDDKEITRHLMRTAILGLKYVGPDANIDRAREYLGYPGNLLALTLQGRMGEHFIPIWSPSKRVLGIIGRNYLKMEPVYDVSLGRMVLPSENIAETLHLLDDGEETFNTLLFVTAEDDALLPIKKDGMESWKFISTKNFGQGTVFCDDPKIRFGVMMGEKYFPKTALRGVYEILAEESFPWHFFACEWSVWKESLSWIILGRHTASHPFEQKRFKEIISEEPLELYKFKDLVYNWRETARQKGKKYSAYFAYYSGEIAFLILAARKAGDTTYQHDNYAKYIELLTHFTDLARNAVNHYSDTEKPGVMMPLLKSWLGVDSEDELFEYIEERMQAFSNEYLKVNNLIPDISHVHTATNILHQAPHRSLSA